MKRIYEPIVGKPIAKVELVNDAEHVVFTFQDGTTHRYGVEGECCSSSWIEHLELPAGGVEGAVITDVEDMCDGPYDGHECTSTEYDNDGKMVKEGCGHDVLQVYNVHFRTQNGDIVLEFRNDSNGYYGGYLV